MSEQNRNSPGNANTRHRPHLRSSPSRGEGVLAEHLANA